jgi:hypothetical protein
LALPGKWKDEFHLRQFVAFAVQHVVHILKTTLNTYLHRDGLEGLRSRKRRRPSYRLDTFTTVEYEYRGAQYGHPSTYAFVRFECAPADKLSFQARTSWPSAVSDDYGIALELAIAEGVADVLLDDTYQHSGCAVTLVEIRYDEICNSERAFMIAAKGAMQHLLNAKWNTKSQSD